MKTYKGKSIDMRNTKYVRVCSWKVKLSPKIESTYHLFYLKGMFEAVDLTSQKLIKTVRRMCSFSFQ